MSTMIKTGILLNRDANSKPEGVAVVSSKEKGLKGRGGVEGEV